MINCKTWGFRLRGSFCCCCWYSDQKLCAMNGIKEKKHIVLNRLHGIIMCIESQHGSQQSDTTNTMNRGGKNWKRKWNIQTIATKFKIFTVTTFPIDYRLDRRCQQVEMRTNEQKSSRERKKEASSYFRCLFFRRLIFVCRNFYLSLRLSPLLIVDEISILGMMVFFRLVWRKIVCKVFNEHEL